MIKALPQDGGGEMKATVVHIDYKPKPITFFEMEMGDWFVWDDELEMPQVKTGYNSCCDVNGICQADLGREIVVFRIRVIFEYSLE